MIHLYISVDASLYFCILFFIYVMRLTNFDFFVISHLYKKPRATQKSLRPCPSPVTLFLL